MIGDRCMQGFVHANMHAWMLAAFVVQAWLLSCKHAWMLAAIVVQAVLISRKHAGMDARCNRYASRAPFMQTSMHGCSLQSLYVLASS